MEKDNKEWSTHIKEVISKAKKKVDILRGLIYRLNRKSLDKLYFRCIRPTLEYVNTICDNISDQEKQEVEKVQLAALRVITGAKKGTSHYLLYDTNII